MKRNLNNQEINEIVDRVTQEFYSVKHLPKHLSVHTISNIQNNMRKQLQTIQIYPEGIPTLVKKIIEKYRLIVPGKSVGIICGQSIGEMQTQMTLNTFHSAGLTNKVVVQGVPRFLEIIDTNRSETQGTPSCYIYLKNRINNVSEIRDIIGNSLVCYYFHNLYVSHNTEIVTTVIDVDWYTDHDRQYVSTTLSPSNNPKTKTRVEYSMNLSSMFRYKIDNYFISEKIREKLQDESVECYVIPSPLFMGKIHVWLGTDDIFVVEEKIHNIIINCKICGTNKIQNIFFTKNKENEWYIETDGSDLEEVLNLPYVDSYKTYSNDIWEIYKLFGIEAVYAYIVEELENLMPTIHKSHLLLLSDRMTVSGKLCSITRYTRKNENTSIFSKTTFEETLSGFINSALHNEHDNINGASASIICGRVPKVGSGMNEIRFDIKNFI